MQAIGTALSSKDKHAMQTNLIGIYRIRGEVDTKKIGGKPFDSTAASISRTEQGQKGDAPSERNFAEDDSRIPECRLLQKNFLW